MYTCAICKKKFKTIKALGGHTSSAHPQNRSEAMSASNNSEAPVGAKATQNTTHPAAKATGRAIEQPQIPPVQSMSTDDEPGIMDTIREYKRRGLHAKQIKDLGYQRQTVDRVFLEDIVPEGKPEEDEHSKNNELPVVYKQAEIFSPEAMLRPCMDGSYEDELFESCRGMSPR